MRKRTNRKVWICVPGVTPLQQAHYQASILTAAEWVEHVQPVQVAIESLCQGYWDAHKDWNPLFSALNRIESMLTLKRADDHGLIGEAQAVFVAALDRQHDTGATTFKAAEMAIIREIGSVYGDLLREITHKDFQAACKHTDANVERIVNQRDPEVQSKSGCLIELKTVAKSRQILKGQK